MQRLIYSFRSLVHLRPRQIYYLVFYRLSGFRRVAVPYISKAFRTDAQGWLIPHRHPIIDEASRTISLLNQTMGYMPGQIDWAPKACSRLWQYHLNYFDFLNQESLSIHEKAALIHHWIRDNPQGKRPGWEPYTVSLRIVNWIAWFVKLDTPPAWNSSLYNQARWLRTNLEWHILANHYFENIKALLYAAIYFRKLGNAFQKEVEEWFRFAVDELDKQLVEQFLPDGGHYERSPLYHNIMIKNCIELLALLRHSGLGQLPLCDLLAEVIQRGVHLAVTIARPDGEFPLFNDSVLQHGPTAADLRGAASALGIVVPPPQDLRWVEAHHTGIYGLSACQDWVMIDCGDIGPAYQPGHTHCDLLSFELVLDGVPVIVDSGVHEYEVSPLRLQLRSTSAHNTVAVNGLEQSEVWSSFRVARRAKKLHGKLEQDADGMSFSGAYRGFYQGLDWVRHRRQMKLNLNSGRTGLDAVEVRDTLEHKRNIDLDCTGFIHLHPEVGVEPRGDGLYRLFNKVRTIAHIQVTGAREVTLAPSIYAPEFGRKFESQKIVIKGERNCIAYKIQKAALD